MKYIAILDSGCAYSFDEEDIYENNEDGIRVNRYTILRIPHSPSMDNTDCEQKAYFRRGNPHSYQFFTVNG